MNKCLSLVAVCSFVVVGELQEINAQNVQQQQQRGMPEVLRQTGTDLAHHKVHVDKQHADPLPCVKVSFNDEELQLTTTICPVELSANIGHFLMLLPGQGNNFDSFVKFQELAQSFGIPSFSVQFEAAPSTYEICANQADLDCSLKVRTARQEGGTHGTLKQQTVPVEKSVDYRTAKILSRLANMSDVKPAPANTGDSELWKSFVNKEIPRWSKAIVMGGSEGSGQALYTGKKYAVRRVLMFAGVDDIVIINQAKGEYKSPPWIEHFNGATRKEQMFGFGDIRGPGCRAWSLNYENLGMKDHWVNVHVADNSVGYKGEQRICTDFGKQSHLDTIWDKYIPFNKDGTSAYTTVWSLMLGYEPSAPLPYMDGIPAPIKKDNAVALSDCLKYAAVTQRWLHDETIKTLNLSGTETPISDPYILTCSSKECKVGDSLKVSTLVAAGPSDGQLWEFSGQHLLNTPSELCIGWKDTRRLEMVLCNDTEKLLKWSYDSNKRLYKARKEELPEGACLAAEYGKVNQTLCHCG